MKVGEKMMRGSNCIFQTLLWAAFGIHSCFQGTSKTSFSDI